MYTWTCIISLKDENETVCLFLSPHTGCNEAKNEAKNEATWNPHTVEKRTAWNPTLRIQIWTHCTVHTVEKSQTTATLIHSQTVRVTFTSTWNFTDWCKFSHLKLNITITFEIKCKWEHLLSTYYTHPQTSKKSERESHLHLNWDLLALHRKFLFILKRHRKR